MIQKIKDWINSFSFSKKMEFRIRRIVEVTTFASGILLIIVAASKILLFKGTFMTNMIEFTAGLIAINIAYRGLVEDLPRIGALVSKRRFWE